MKPHIVKWKELWECRGLGLYSFGKTPEESYTRWLTFIKRMER